MAEKTTEAVHIKPTPSIIEEHCRCAGIFLVKYDKDAKNIQQSVEVLMVEGKRKCYQYSFPKGKRNKGEKTIDTAKRELLEETGIEEKDYELIPGKWYLEYRQEVEQPHIVYFLAVLKNNDAILAPQDTREIVSANWFKPQDIYTMKRTFYLQRRQIVTRAVRDFCFKMNVEKNNMLARSIGLPENILMKDWDTDISRERNPFLNKSYYTKIRNPVEPVDRSAKLDLL